MASKTPGQYVAELRKFLLTLAAALGSVFASGLVQGTLATELTLVIAIIGAAATALVFFVPNAIPAATLQAAVAAHLAKTGRHEAPELGHE